MPIRLLSKEEKTKLMTKCISAKYIGLAFLLSLAVPSAHAANKDMVQLQTQIQELQTAVARLQQSNDERMGVLKDLVQQSADSVNKMSVVVDSLQLQMRAQHDAVTAKTDQVSGQVQALNDSLDEIKARLNNVEKSLQSLENQQQSIDAALQNLAPTATTSAVSGATPPPTENSSPLQSSAPSSGANLPATPQPTASPAYAATQTSSYAAVPSSKTAAPSIAALYKTALSDWMAAQYPLATTEFNEITRSNPTDPLAGNSYYYLGEIEFRNGKYSNAIKDYDRVLDQFPDNPKVPVSHLHKGQALFEIGKREAGITELRTLITRFPHAPEAAQARSKLSGMGVSAVAKHP
jgi:TolA-binding protein